MIQKLFRQTADRRTQLVLLLAAVLWAGGCTGAKVAQSRQGGSPNKITHQQIQEVEGMLSAYKLVQRLRPSWLRKRGQHSITQPSPIRVYVEGMSYGGIDTLKRIQISEIQSMEFLGARRATNRFGTGHLNGAILVHMKGS